MPPLFSDVAQVVCSAGVLPRKELFEAWEVAVRVDAAFPFQPVVADLASGHGLLAWMMLLLGAARGARRRAVCVDTRLPESALKLSAAFTKRWPELEARMQYVEGSMVNVVARPGEAVFAAVHACGPLSDLVIERALSSGCALALMPCCHSLRNQPLPPLAGLDRPTLERMAEALGQPAAIDACRMASLRSRGYRVEQEFISVEISPYNRLILAEPPPNFDPALAAAFAASFAVGELPLLKRRPRHAAQPAVAIPLGDETALAAISGRRKIDSCRSIGLSMWMPTVGAVSEARLLAIAAAAVVAQSTPRSAGSVPEAPCTAPVEWDVAAVLAASEAVGQGGAPPEQRGVEEASAAAGEEGATVTTIVDDVRVTVTLREVFFTPDAAQRACAFKLDFSSGESSLSKGDAALWQVGPSLKQMHS